MGCILFRSNFTKRLYSTGNSEIGVYDMVSCEGLAGTPIVTISATDRQFKARGFFVLMLFLISFITSPERNYFFLFFFFFLHGVVIKCLFILNIKWFQVSTPKEGQGTSAGKVMEGPLGFPRNNLYFLLAT